MLALWRQISMADMAASAPTASWGPRKSRPASGAATAAGVAILYEARVSDITVEGDSFTARAAGDRAKVPEQIAGVLAGTVELTALDARLVQPYYAKQLARSAGLALSMEMDGADVVVKAA